MKNLNYILASSLFLSINAKSFDLESLKKDAQKIGTTIYKNISREERKIETFEIDGDKIHSSKELIDLKKGNVSYTINQNDKTIYISIRPKKQTKKETNYTDFFTISESTDLFIATPQENNILNYSSQGDFIKQKFSGKIEITKKGLHNLEEHPEAEKMLNNSKKALENIISIFGERVKKKIENIPNKYSSEYIQEMKEKLEIPENFNLKRIPMGVPDKLTGQKLSTIEYKINFEKTPSKVIIYSILDLKEHEYRLIKKIEK